MDAMVTRYEVAKGFMENIGDAAFFKKYPIGDSCLCWSLGMVIDRDVSRKILAAYRELKTGLAEEPGFRDLVPSYTALALHFDPLVADIPRIEAVIRQRLVNLPEEETNTGKAFRLTVRYNGCDLKRVADHAGIPVRDVIDRHKAVTYTVAMIGFIPHFPYLLGLDKHIETPRLPSPRTKVPAGSVAIGGSQTGVYPAESPGGWNIIGTTDPLPLKRIAPGDTVIFCEE